MASHLGAFVAGAIAATALGALALPGSRANSERYAALDTFAQSLAYIANQYVEPVDERVLIHGAVEGMVSRLDEHSAFYSPKSYKRLREDTEGEFGGVGITLEAGEPSPADGTPGPPAISEILPGSPAARAGLLVGDRLLAIDEQPTTGTDADAGVQAQRQAADAGAQAQGQAQVQAWTTRLRGRSGTRIELTVARSSWPTPRRVTLVRERIKVPTVEYLELEPGIGYLAIKRFQEATAADTAAAVVKLTDQGMRVLILDLRGNPGGLLDQAVRVADLFLDQGLIVTIRSRTGSDEQQMAHAPGTYRDIRLLVMVDESSASAAEIVAGALQDHGRATILGQPTYGKGSVQTFIDLRDGSGLKLTTARYYTPSGQTLEATGITPDILVEAFAGEVVIAGTPDPEPGIDEPAAVTQSLRERLIGDQQFDVALQTVRPWLGRKSPAGGQ